MAFWINQFDHVYQQRPKSLADAAERFVEEAACSRDQIDELRQRSDTQMKILRAILNTLDEANGARVAKELGFKPASNGGGN
jgi:hypothetical protein